MIEEDLGVGREGFSSPSPKRSIEADANAPIVHQGREGRSSGTMGIQLVVGRDIELLCGRRVKRHSVAVVRAIHHNAGRGLGLHNTT